MAVISFDYSKIPFDVEAVPMEKNDLLSCPFCTSSVEEMENRLENNYSVLQCECGVWLQYDKFNWFEFVSRWPVQERK